MDDHSLARRNFITTSAAAAAALALPFSGRGAGQSATSKAWPIGCHGRPFNRFRLSHDDLLDAIKAAGYKSADMISIAPAAARGASPAAAGTAPAPAQRGRGAVTVTPEMVAALKEKLAARGMVSNVCSLSIQTGVPLPEAIATLTKAAAGDPAQSEIHEHLGDALYSSGRRIEARFSWQAALITAKDKAKTRLESKLESGLTPATAAP